MNDGRGGDAIGKNACAVLYDVLTFSWYSFHTSAFPSPFAAISLRHSQLK